MQFLEKYIKYSENAGNMSLNIKDINNVNNINIIDNIQSSQKFEYIKKMILLISSRENIKPLLKEAKREYIKNKLISYYNVRNCYLPNSQF